MIEEQLAACLSEGQIAEFVENHGVNTYETVCDAALTAGAGLGFEPGDQIDDIVEADADTTADAGPGNGDGGYCRFRCRRSARRYVVRPGITTCKIAHQAFIDRRVVL